MGNNTPEDIPIVYRDEYNITFMGLEKKHPFDSKKFGKIAKYLVKQELVPSMNCYKKPKKVSKEQLEEYHTKLYLDRISKPDGLLAALEFNVRSVVENEIGGVLKNLALFVLNKESVFKFGVDYIIGNALLYQVGGTILAGELAMKHGWAINIGGGMHHASAGEGGGWCVYGDIQMSINNLRKKHNVKKAMVIDFDVHRGNGHAIDKGKDLYGPKASIFTIDIFEKGNYPANRAGLDQINLPRALSNVDTETYLTNVVEVLVEGFELFKPDVVFYNAGSDILNTDPLGGFNVTPDGVAERDRLVFEFCLNRGAPVVYLTSGGYAKENAEVVGKSLESLLKFIKKFYEDKAKRMENAKNKENEKKENEDEEEGESEEEKKTTNESKFSKKELKKLKNEEEKKKKVEKRLKKYMRDEGIPIPPPMDEISDKKKNEEMEGESEEEKKIE